ncbi:MAG: immunoglobulin domain-containing protein [Verrucomicrobia subdivision 3 bacterium]|nr:immunoglobulin domain-containing protein [Limisphaerales bacterium]
MGTNIVMGIFNSAVTYQARNGSTLITNTLRNFWETNLLYNHLTDPRVVYDPYLHRWIAVCAADTGTTNSSILIGVSSGSNPTNGWNQWQIKADTNNLFWGDYPYLGFNKHWIVIQVNMIDLTFNQPQRSHIYVFNKTNLYAGNFTAPTFIVHTNAEAAGNEVPAITYDTNLSTMYLLQSANGNTNGSGYLRLFTITGAVGSEVLNNVTNPVYIQVSNAWANAWTNYYPEFGYDCCFAPQSNTAVRIGTVVDARLGNVVYRNGHLWAAQTIFLPTNDVARRSSIQWFQIKPSTEELIQCGRIDDPTGVEYYGFASIGVNKFNDVLIGYTSFSTNYYASVAYSFRDFYNPMNTLRPRRVYWYGEGPIEGVSRWGDYSSTTVDSLNDTDLWTIQEYAGPSPEPLIGIAGTRWAHVSVPVPTNDNFAASYAISGAQGSTNGTTIRATRESGETNHAGNANTPSVWYTWTAPGNGNVAFELTNTFFAGSQAALAIYTGSSVSSLTLVTNRAAPAPNVTFNASSGTAYRVAVIGYNNSAANFTFKWIQPTAPYFVEHPQTTNVVVGENVTLNSAAIGAPSPGYQWRREGNNVSGATSSSYSINDVQFSHGTNYTVVASNVSGLTTSSVAALIVHGDSAARLSNWVFTGSEFRVRIGNSLTNRPYVVQTSTNLNTATTGFPSSPTGCRIGTQTCT